jgi:hypothetical protein
MTPAKLVDPVLIPVLHKFMIRAMMVSLLLLDLKIALAAKPV